MKRFKNILVVSATASGDNKALERAVRLASDNAARLTVAVCFDEKEYEQSFHQLVNEIVLGLEEQLEIIVEPARKQGLIVETRVLVGKAFIEIIKQVLRNGHDLVMKTAQETSRAELLLFSSTDMKLMRKCPCPVWMISPRLGETTGSILAAVDPDAVEGEGQALNTTIMELATSLSMLEECPLHVVHAWSVPYEDTLRHSPFLRVSHPDAAKHIAEIETRHKNGLNNLVAKFHRVAPEMNVHLIKGGAWEVIPTLAKEKNVEVVIMGTVCRTGLAGLIIGNTAEEVLQRMDCSVLAIKPQGFVSPVTLETP